LRLLPEELQRVAVHEAGHALALYFSPGGAERIGFITILPRPDGTLGFVAQLPDQRMNPTRRSYVTQLEVVLAGRAAEQLVYGDEDISSGASSDLQVATSIATTMVTRLGLAGDGRLRVTEQPTEEQLQAIDSILEGTYDTVLGKLQKHRASLELVVAELIKRQELTGTDLQKLI
jgi:ATP-dependent Zn protease